MSTKREEGIAWALTGLQQVPAITKIAIDDALLTKLRNLVRTAKAEALRQMRVQAQIDRDRIEHERQHAHYFATTNEELAVKNEKLTIREAGGKGRAAYAQEPGAYDQ